MKNKIKTLLALLLVVVTSLSLVACENNNNNNTANTSDTDNPTINNSETVQLDKFQQFEKGLSDRQIEFEVVQKMGSMVGAKEGYGYNFGDETSVELYIFDKTSDAYKEAVKSNKLYLESFGITMDVVFNDDICIYYNGEVTNKSDIEEIFKSLKQ